VTARSLWFALSRPAFWIPAGLGTGLIAGDVTTVGGVLLLVFAATRLQRILGHRDLDRRLRLRDEKHGHGVQRRLADAERAELLTLDAYCEDLRQAGAGTRLCDEVRAQAWAILQRGEPDSVDHLRRLRHGLPPLPPEGSAVADPNLSARIQRELDLLRATQKEVEQVG